MSYLVKILIVAIAAGFAIIYKILIDIPPLPQVQNTWWGKGKQQPEDKAIIPFSINVSSKVIEDLNTRLDASIATLTPPLEGISFEYGFNTETLRKIIYYWRNDYNWTNRETYLNSVPQFTTRISGLNIHFLHVIPDLSDEDAKSFKILPLLMLHGWPGSIREMYEIIPLLTTPVKDPAYGYVFELIIPSLPGYGFSEGAHRPGLTTAHIGLIMKRLMEKLGFQRFYVHGGDWGSVIASEMATLFPKSILGMHSNMCYASSPLNILKVILGSLTSPTLFADAYSAARIYPLSRYLSFLIQESGYMHLQATKPDTIGIALRDSPAGLAAYILEKFSTWTRASWISAPDGGLNLSDKPQKRDDGGNLIPITTLLDNVMIYYITGSITTSMRLYSEVLSPSHLKLNFDSIPVVNVPASCVRFPEELMHTPEFAIRSKFPRLVRLSTFQRGGHFIAMEEPKLLADDIYDGIKSMEYEHKKDEAQKLKMRV